MSKCGRCEKRDVKVTTAPTCDGRQKEFIEIFCEACIEEIEAEAKTEERKQKREKEKERLEALVTRAEIPYRDTDNRAKPLLKRVKKEWSTDQGLFVFGPTGTMKTRSLCVLAVRAIRKGHTCVWINCSPMLRRYSHACKEGNGDDMLDAYIRPDILVIDDWGKGKVTDRGAEFLYDVTNIRFERGRPIWMTSNLAPEFVKSWIRDDDGNYGPVIERRILEGCAVINTGEK